MQPKILSNVKHESILIGIVGISVSKLMVVMSGTDYIPPLEPADYIDRIVMHLILPETAGKEPKISF